MTTGVENKQAMTNGSADYPLPVYEMTMRLDAARKAIKEVANMIRNIDSEHVVGWGWLCPWERRAATTTALDVLWAMAMDCKEEADLAVQAVEAEVSRFADAVKEASAAGRAQVGA